MIRYVVCLSASAPCVAFLWPCFPPFSSLMLRTCEALVRQKQASREKTTNITHKTNTQLETLIELRFLDSLSSSKFPVEQFEATASQSTVPSPPLDCSPSHSASRQQPVRRLACARPISLSLSLSFIYIYIYTHTFIYSLDLHVCTYYVILYIYIYIYVYIHTGAHEQVREVRAGLVHGPGARAIIYVYTCMCYTCTVMYICILMYYIYIYI